MTADVIPFCPPRQTFTNRIRELAAADQVGWGEAIAKEPCGRINLRNAQRCLEEGCLVSNPVMDGENRWCGVMEATVAGRPIRVSFCIEVQDDSSRWINVLKIEE